MLVFWKENLVFLAVPKTGTTAIEGALSPYAAMVLRDPPQIKHARYIGTAGSCSRCLKRRVERILILSRSFATPLSGFQAGIGTATGTLLSGKKTAPET